MSQQSDSSDVYQCSHLELAFGPRGANWVDWGVFLYSQTNDYKCSKNIVATINLPDLHIAKDVIPFEYYEALISEERNHLESGTIALPTKVLVVRK